MDKLKQEGISAFFTFASSFVLAVATVISTGGTVEWSYAFWGSVILAALRVAVKAGLNTFIPTTLGGRKVI